MPHLQLRENSRQLISKLIWKIQNAFHLSRLTTERMTAVRQLRSISNKTISFSRHKQIHFFTTIVVSTNNPADDSFASFIFSLLRLCRAANDNTHTHIHQTIASAEVHTLFDPFALVSTESLALIMWPVHFPHIWCPVSHKHFSINYGVIIDTSLSIIEITKRSASTPNLNKYYENDKFGNCVCFILNIENTLDKPSTNI